MDNKTIYAINY